MPSCYLNVILILLFGPNLTSLTKAGNITQTISEASAMLIIEKIEDDSTEPPPSQFLQLPHN